MLNEQMKNNLETRDRISVAENIIIMIMKTINRPRWLFIPVYVLLLIFARIKIQEVNSESVELLARLITHIIHEHQPVTRLPSINCLLKNRLETVNNTQGTHLIEFDTHAVQTAQRLGLDMSERQTEISLNKYRRDYVFINR